MQGNFKYPRIKKIYQKIVKITRIDQKDQTHCVLLSHEILSTKIYYTSIYIFYILFISRQFQKSKNDVNPTCTSEDTCKTILFIIYKLFSIGDSFKFNATQETRLI